MDISTYINIPIFAIVYMVMEAIKKLFLKTDKQRGLIPIIAPFMGALISCAIYNIVPEWIICSNGLDAFIIGLFSGAAATSGNQIYKQLNKILSGAYDE